MPISIVKMYYDYLKDGKIVGKRCHRCRKITFPPTTRCEYCGSDDQDWFVLTGRGKLLFVSHGMTPTPNPRFDELAPYAYGHIKLEEGVIVEAIITNVGITPDELNDYYEKGPVDVEAEIMEVMDLPILAFKVSSLES